MLDIDAENLDGIASQICNQLVSSKVIEKEFSNILKATLLARHHHKDKQQPKQHEVNTCHRELMPMISQNMVDPIANQR